MTGLSETAIALVVLPVCLMIVTVCWLIAGSRGGKPFTISIRGLGIEFSIKRASSTNEIQKEKSNVSEG